MKLVIKLFNKKNDKERFARIIKYFSAITAFVFYFDPKQSDN